MIGGEFDLSAGVAVTASSLAASMFATRIAGNLWAGIGFALLFSLAVGWINGYLLIRTRLHSFLVTLSTFLMLQGLNIAITKLVTGNVATEDISGMPGFESAKAVFAVEHPDRQRFRQHRGVLLDRIRAARHLDAAAHTGSANWIFAVGGQGDSARAVGIPVRRVKVGLFMLVGVSVWFLGMHMLFAYNTVQSGAGIGNELLFIASAVVGGCLMTGGYGSAAGSAFGAFMFGMANEGVIYADWDPDWFMFFVGAMLLLATVFNTWFRGRIGKGG